MMGKNRNGTSLLDQSGIDAYQELFTHMADEYGLILLQSEMDEIIRLSKGVVSKWDDDGGK